MTPRSLSFGPLALASLLLLASSLGCGVLTAPVARTVDGVTTEGRFIDPDAYALYAIGALREARGQWSEALELYQRALDLDGRGPELRTRVGAVACRLHQDRVADRAFGAAAREAADYGPLWFELAQCRKMRADLAGAQSAALEAVRLDPERYEASLLAADLAEMRGDRALSWQLRDALATHAPESLPVQRSILAAAIKSDDRVRRARAESAIAELSSRVAPLHSLDGVARALTALEQGDLTRARREAEQLLGADPSNGEALVLALCAADLQQDHAHFNALLARSDEPATPASPRILRALAELLGRRVSTRAAELVKPEP